MQNRVGPPFFQPLFDFLKLLNKETFNIKGTRNLSFCAILAFSAIATLSLFISVDGKPILSFYGDIFVVIYLLLLTSVSFVLAGYFSGSPFTITGANREMMLLLVSDLIISLSIFFIGLSGDLTLANVDGMMLLSYPVLAAGFIIAAQAQLGLQPFNIAEAEQEIVSGAMTEYSGSILGLFNLSKAIRLFVIISLITVLFLNPANFLVFISMSLFFLFMVTVLRTVTFRLRIDQTFKFYLFVFLFSLIDVLRMLI